MSPASIRKERYYLLLRYGDQYDIANDDANFLVARAYPLRPDEGGPGYTVRICMTDDDKCPELLIKSINEAIPAVAAAYYEANPPRWKRESDLTSPCGMEPCRACYLKETQ